MTRTPETVPARRARHQRLAVAAFAVTLVLFPPLHWLVTGGSAVVGLGYFLGSGVLVVLSLLLIATLDARMED